MRFILPIIFLFFGFNVFSQVDFEKQTNAKDYLSFYSSIATIGDTSNIKNGIWDGATVFVEDSGKVFVYNGTGFIEFEGANVEKIVQIVRDSGFVENNIYTDDGAIGEERHILVDVFNNEGIGFGYTEETGVARFDPFVALNDGFGMHPIKGPYMSGSTGDGNIPMVLAKYQGFPAMLYVTPTDTLGWRLRNGIEGILNQTLWLNIDYRPGLNAPNIIGRTFSTPGTQPYADYEGDRYMLIQNIVNQAGFINTPTMIDPVELINEAVLKDTTSYTTNQTIRLGEYNLADVRAGSVTFTIPAGATAGQSFTVVDSWGNAGTNPITVNLVTNSYRSHGDTGNYTMNVDNSITKWTFINAAVGWIVETK